MIATVLAAASSAVHAQTDLTAYADANGYIDVQALTCAALAEPGRETPTGSQPGTAAGTTASQRSTISISLGQRNSSTKLLCTARLIREFELSKR